MTPAARLGIIEYVHVLLAQDVALIIALVYRNCASELAILPDKVISAAKVLDVTKQNLKHAETDARCVLRHLMTGEKGSIESEPTLLDPFAEVAGAGKRSPIPLGVIGCVERSAWIFGKTLNAVPSHVLEGEEAAVGGDEHVEVTGADQDVVGVLNNVLERAVYGRWEGGVCVIFIAVGEDVDVCALHPVGVGVDVESLLDIGSVEVNLNAWRGVVSCVDYAHDIVHEWARVCDMVDVETRVDL